MNIVIITMGLSRVVAPLFNSEHDVVGVIECSPRVKPSAHKLITILGALKRLFLPDAPTLKSFCDDKNAPYRYMNSSDDQGLKQWLEALNPDVIVVYSMSQLLKRSLFDIPNYGTINLHPAYLPEYRGPNPDFWQYFDTVLEPGVTVHYIDDGEDTGDIILQERATIPLGMKSKEHLDLMIGNIGVRLLINSLDLLSNREVLPQPQPVISPTAKARNIRTEEHQDIIDWEVWSAERVWHLIRGTEGWLNAIDQPKGFFKGQRWVVEDLEKGDFGKSYGQMHKGNDGRYLIVNGGRIKLSMNFSLKKMIVGLLGG